MSGYTNDIKVTHVVKSLHTSQNYRGDLHTSVMKNQPS